MKQDIPFSVVRECFSISSPANNIHSKRWWKVIDRTYEYGKVLAVVGRNINAELTAAALEVDFIYGNLDTAVEYATKEYIKLMQKIDSELLGE